MSKQRKSGVVALSASRRRFLSGVLRSGLTLAGANALGEVAFAGEKGRKPIPGAYDYIVVGVGSAGCVVTDRLSAAGFNVLAIEAGTGDIQQLKISQASQHLANIGSDTVWQIPVPAQPGLNGRTQMMMSGRAVGGGGSINGMAWFRPDVRDLEILARQLGPRWSPANFYAAIRRAERFVTGNSSGRSLDGKMTVGRYSPAYSITEAFMQAAGELSMPLLDSNTTPHINGMGCIDVNIERDGRRSGPAQTYFADAIARNNVDLAADALVTKLLIHGNICVGVECVVNGRVERFYASRDVVLSAGALGSAKLLMLSGIGQARDLRRLGIKVVHNLPAVGANFQDHVLMTTNYRAGPAYVDQETVGHIATVGWSSTEGSRSPPNIQNATLFKPFPPGAIADGYGFTLASALMKPKSRGSVTLQSKDPRVPVVPDAAYLSDSRDVEAMVRSLEISMAIGSASALRPFVNQPDFNAEDLTSRQAKVQFVRNNAQAYVHPTSTCSAGTDPARSVVNPALQVWGIRNLRVVDGSVLPESPGVNPHVTIIGVAELASQMMLHGH